MCMCVCVTDRGTQCDDVICQGVNPYPSLSLFYLSFSCVAHNALQHWVCSDIVRERSGKRRLDWTMEKTWRGDGHCRGGVGHMRDGVDENDEEDEGSVMVESHMRSGGGGCLLTN